MWNTAIAITQISINALHPGEYNPDRQTDKECAESAGRVWRLGWLPEPIVVRHDADRGGYVIMHGEHMWRAAKQNGFIEVPCVVADIDSFSAICRNCTCSCGDINNPVLLGRAFKASQEERGLAPKELANDINVPAATIRLFLRYAEASELRAKYNPDDCVDAVAKMNRRELEVYRGLGGGLRDKWFDATCSLQKRDGLDDTSVCNSAMRLFKVGFAHLVEADPMRFQPSLEFALELAAWYEKHRVIRDIRLCVDAVAQVRMGNDRNFPPVRLLDHLPCCRDRGGSIVAMSPDEWYRILYYAVRRAKDEEDLIGLVEKDVQRELTQAGVAPGDVIGSGYAAALQVVAGGPPFIRTSEWLTLDEQAWLTQATADVPDYVLEKAKELTCRMLQRQRSLASAGGGEDRDRKDGANGEVAARFNRCLAILMGR